MQSGIGSAIRPVTWVPSATVERSDGLITSGAGAGGSQATNPAATSSAVTTNTPSRDARRHGTPGARWVQSVTNPVKVPSSDRSARSTRHGRHVDRTVDVGVAAGRVVEAGRRGDRIEVDLEARYERGSSR